MFLSLIAAVSENGIIGRDGDLPWRLSSDLKRFKAVTMGKPIIMGRKTYDSIGRPLPGRQNIVVTRNPNLGIKGCTVVQSLEDALAAAGDVEEAIVIGGESIYEAALPFASQLYLTTVHTQVQGDARFPEVDFSKWETLAEVQCDADDRNEFSTTYRVLRKPSGGANDG